MECDLKTKSNPKMKEYIDSLEIVLPLEPRDVFHD
jgi:hypothetical protein